MDDGKSSDWLEIEQGFPQGFVLAPLPFNRVFTAVLKTAKEAFL